MTFYEAAVEVLKTAARPLHYKKITELAIKQQLLSHVGKTPEVTMGSRLVQEVQRGETTTAIVRTRPGVYALRIWETEPPKPQPVAPAAEASPADDDDGERRGRRRRRRRRGGSDDTNSGRRGTNGRGDAASSDAPEAKTEGGDAPLNPFDLYSEGSIYADEEDESVVGPTTEDAPEAEAAEASPAPDEARSERGSRGSGRRRSRRRRDRDEDDGEASASSDAPKNERPQRDAGQESKGSGRRPRNERRSGRRSSRRDRRDRGLTSPAVVALRALRDTGEPATIKTLAANAKLDGDGEAISAALVTDNQVRESKGLRPFFVKTLDGRWALTEWKISKGAQKAEQRLHDAAREMRRDAIDQLAKTLTTFSVDTWQHLVLALLKHMGYIVLGTTKKDENTIVVRAEHRVGLTSVFVAIELCDCDELGRNSVTELRGTLHHHDSSRGVIFTTGYVAEEAIAESRIANLAPITLIGRKHLAEMLLDAGIGVHKLQLPIYYVDHGFFERLKG